METNYFNNVADTVKDEIYIGRDLEVRRLQQILERHKKNHPILVGDHGVGKKSIVGALAQRISAKEVHTNLINTSLLELEMSNVVAGSKLRGEAEEKLKKAFLSVKDNSIICIYDIDTLFATGAISDGIGNFLKSMLNKGEIQVLATTSPDGLRKLQEKDPALVRCFTALNIDAPTVEQSIEILRGIATKYEEHHRVKIGDPAIVASVQLAKRYIQDRALPDSAVDLLDESAARKRVEIDGLPAHLDNSIRRLSSLKSQRVALVGDLDSMSLKTMARIDQEIADIEPDISKMRSKIEVGRDTLQSLSKTKEEIIKAEKQIVLAKDKENYQQLGTLEYKILPELQKRLAALESNAIKLSLKELSNNVSEEDVALVLGDWTGIPVSKMLESETDKLIKMEKNLGKRVVGQDEAVSAIARAVRRGRVGLRDAGKPIGSFLFLGPSGVGKTELAKAVAEFLFDDEQAMTRIDMSEFMEKHMAQRLVGSPPGYADSENGGFLTEAVRRRPYSVLLFDEVEKAHADVFNLLLQVLDDGRLTDGRGRVADFSNTVVIMTSNIGSKKILDANLGLFESPEGIEKIRSVVLGEVKNFMRPEFLNRIDESVIFKPLSKSDLRNIVDIQLKYLDKLVADREIKLHLTEEAKMALVDMSYEPAFGARPLKRAITKKLQDPLAEEILSGGYKPGDTLNVSVESGNKFVFSKNNED
jgi:ATP-dependent Clp protease ATP-binding subunit ClpB